MATAAATVIVSFCLLYVFHVCIEFWRALRSINNHPGYRTLLAQSSVLANFLKPIPGIALGPNHLFANKHRVFEQFGGDIISAVSAWPQTTTLILADAAAIKSPIQRNNKMVWDETVKIMESLFDDLWSDKNIIITDHCLELVVPERALNLTQRLRNVKLAFEELERYMLEMVKERQAEKKEARYDLFSSLLDANEADSDEAKLSVSELIGTFFEPAFACNEMTKRKVISSSSWSLGMSVFYETLRMFPPVKYFYVLEKCA
ncbi:hypothetical protein C0991_001659 [Blastosporella zonata]|nr:hypothetical protein C0991_001659 [Blastosporella zonata]